MTVIPILLDARPAYLASDGADAADSAASLLLLPAGAGAVVGELVERVAAVTSHAPYVLPHFAPGPRYVGALQRAAPGLAGLVGPEVLRDPLARFDPSDTLLLVSAECYPLRGPELAALVGARGRAPQMLRHLLAFEAGAFGAREFVQSDADGRLRRVQRYFEPATWPFPAGVIASLVPVACVLMAPEAPPPSLAALRATLAAQGVPSQDVAYHGRLVDLTDEPGALALAEERLLRLIDGAAGGGDPARVPSPMILGQAVRVHASARFVGPVVLAAGACVEADALVIGPALIGPGAHVGRGATVAQCVVLDGARVADAGNVRHRVVAGHGPGGGAARQQERRAIGVPAAPAPRRRGGYLAVKALVEPVAAAALLLALAPVFAAFAVLIVLDSGLPVFYGDRREGYGGAPFRCWKFRTMRANADVEQRTLAAQQQLDGPQFKMARDPRVTRVGRWLRRLNVDELPQLWNVVRGQMSFVGPRPSPFRENQICVPWRHGRLSVRPGITGLWQVCRHDRAAGDFHQWIHYDLLYVRHASLRVDARILARTLLTLGGRRPTRVERILPAARGHVPLGHVPERHAPAAAAPADADASLSPVRPSPAWPNRAQGAARPPRLSRHTERS